MSRLSAPRSRAGAIAEILSHPDRQRKPPSRRSSRRRRLLPCRRQHAAWPHPFHFPVGM